MLKNYIKIAVRNLGKNKTYSFINILGLSIGITCTLFMMMWVVDELSWDKFQTNADTLFRVEQDQPNPKGMFHVNLTPFPMGPALKEEIPEVKNSARMVFPGTILMQFGEKLFYENQAVIVDPAYLDMFTFPLIKGNKEAVLNDPTSIVLTEDIAEKYFGNENPIGKILLVNTKYNFKVTGIMRKLPSNTYLQENILLPFSFAKTMGLNTETWGRNYIYTWVQLYKNQNISEINEKITELRQRHILEQLKNTPGAKINQRRTIPQFKLMPLTDLRLYERFGFGQSVGSIQSVSIFSIMAIFILLIACVNFMNLSTAQSVGRAKEVGLRKVLGAKRTSLAWQFHGESILLTLIASAFALTFVEFLIPVFNSISGKDFTSVTPFQSKFLPAILLIVLLTGIISGTYPALYLSNFRPLEVIRGRFKSGSKGSFMRKALVVFQFSLSIIFIIGTFMMSKQLQYMRNKNIGYDKEHLIYIPLRGATQKSYSALKSQLENEPLVNSVSGTLQPPTYMSANGGGADWDGKDPNFNPLIGYAGVDYDYVKTLKIQLAEGRAFSKNYATDSTNGVLINETLAKMIGGGSSVVGKKFNWDNNGIITGVMKNYNYSRIQSAIEPLAVYLTPSQINFAVVRLNAGNISRSIDEVKDIWQKVNPNYPFEYTFFDEDFAKMFQSDERMGTLFGYSSLFAILVACLGLFGLSSFMAEQRTREIGVRKVLGASISEITVLFSKEFVKWILIANILAWPFAYLLIEKLLQDYAYRIPFLWWVYPLTFVLTVTVALLTVGYQSIKAAMTNPVESLRYE
jgi:putative ABC transport system permease protein